MRVRARLLAALAVATLVIVSGCGTSSTVDPSPAPGSPSPVSEAILAARVERYVDDHGLRYDTIRSVRVQVDGISRLEHYRAGADASSHLHVWSVTKSIVSVLVGIAIAEGKLSGLDATLVELLPEHAAQMTTTQRRITLEQLLTMTGGLADDDHIDPATFEVSAEGILSQELQAEPGTQFIYSNAGAHLVSVILAEATGESPLAYGRRVLFDPLSIHTEPAYTRFEPSVEGSTDFRAFSGFAWATDADGVNNGCCMMRLTSDDMLAIGQLLLNEGKLGDRVIVPADWVAASTRPSRLNEEYGYLWWREGIRGMDGYAAVGAGGQLIVIIPERRSVITMASEPSDTAFLEAADAIALIDEVIAPVLG